MPIIVYQGKKIEYEIQRKKVKRVNLRITEKGEIMVSAPKRTSEAFVQAFVQSKAAWIVDCIKNREQKKLEKRPEPEAINGSFLLLFGTFYPLVVLKGTSPQFAVENGHCVLRVTDESNREKCNGQLQEQLKKICYQICCDRLPKVAAGFSSYRIPEPVIKMRKMKSCWGSCHIKKNIITVNTRLVHAPLCCIDYILAHELAHLVEPNHSPAFYHVLQTAYPKAKEHKALLSSQNIL